MNETSSGCLRRWTLRFDDWSTMPLSLNRSYHWAVEAKLKRMVRQRAKVLARVQHIPPCARVRVTLEWFVTDSRPRDTDNPVATLKPLCDGLVDAGIVPDDTPAYMQKNEVVITYVPRRAGGVAHVELHIEEVA